MPKLEENNDMIGHLLKCPICGEDYLHHECVETFSREDDATTGLHVSVEKLSVSTDNNVSANPSPRRDGVKIRFWCELCRGKPTLEIIQHKGCTYMSWCE
jgi:hypothetical protein